ncbi:MAG: hypothetical protein AELANPGJ_03601 [Anaerolineae bacterium]|nr:hypothetical protein [Anaerolineae bacterium]
MNERFAVLDTYFDPKSNDVYLSIAFVIGDKIKHIRKFLTWHGSFETLVEKIEVATAYAESFGFPVLYNFCLEDISDLYNELEEYYDSDIS